MTKNYSFLSALKQHINSSIVLIFFTIFALILANIPGIKEWYFSLWELPVSLSIGNFNFFSHNGHSITLGEVINDFLMAIFFLSVGLEIKREIKVGELSSMRKALLPLIGALGGMIVPVLLFYLVCPGDAIMQRGMAIPMATDIAFSLGILALFKTRVPIGLKLFLVALAVADDLGGIIVIALFYSSSIHALYLVLASLCTAILLLGNVFKIRKNIFYISVGLVLWYLILNSGIHATIAGVIVAFCIPATIVEGTGIYLERIRENISKIPIIENGKLRNAIVLTNEQMHIFKSIESASDKMVSPLQSLEDHLKSPINYVIIPLFAFANAGIDLSQMSATSIVSGVSLAAMLGLVVGKFLGVFSFSWIAVRMGIVSLPHNTSWKAFASVSIVCGIGFTVSMFIANLSYGDLGAEGNILLEQAKLGVFLGSIIAAVLGCILLNRTLPTSYE